MGDANIIAKFEPIRVILYCQAKFHNGKTGQVGIEQISSFSEQSELMDIFKNWMGNFLRGSVFAGGDYPSQKVKCSTNRQFSKTLIEAGPEYLDQAI